MVLTYLLYSALVVVAAAHSGSLSAHVPESMCSGPCPAQSEESFVLIQRFASMVMEDTHKTVQDIASVEDINKYKQEIATSDKNAKQKDLVNKEIEGNNKARQVIAKLEKELAEQKLEENGTVLGHPGFYRGGSKALCKCSSQLQTPCSVLDFSGGEGIHGNPVMGCNGQLCCGRNEGLCNVGCKAPPEVVSVCKCSHPPQGSSVLSTCSVLDFSSGEGINGNPVAGCNGQLCCGPNEGLCNVGCQAPTAAPTTKPPTHAVSCQSWCEPSSRDWATKCEFNACLACANCADHPGQQKPGGQVCESWCKYSTRPWTTKCNFERACAGCTGC